MTPRTIVELENVTKQYGSPDGSAATAVLGGITLSVAAGESLAIVGPSGSGKSTLLNIIGAIDRPTTGRVIVAGTDLGSASDDDLALLRNEKIGFVFQLHHLLPQCTVLENVLVPALARRRVVAPATEDRARRLLDRVGLGHRLDYRPGQLSGGERQRVAVARALINAPALVLADEPTGSLDRSAAEELARLLTDLNKEEGMTLLVVTHSSALADRLGRTMELRDGRLLLQKGPP